MAISREFRMRLAVGDMLFEDMLTIWPFHLPLHDAILAGKFAGPIAAEPSQRQTTRVVMAIAGDTYDCHLYDEDNGL